MTTFLLIRHAETDAIGRYLAGTAPGTHLNNAGRQQAERLAERLHNTPLAAIVSSPLERTRETADPIAVSHGLKTVIVPELLELEFGRWTGTPLQELYTCRDWQRFNRARSITRAPEGELMLEVQVRAIRALLDLRAQFPSGNVAVVSHADVIRAILLFFLGMPLDLYWRLEIAPASISVLELDENGGRVRPT